MSKRNIILCGVGGINLVCIVIALITIFTFALPRSVDSSVGVARMQIAEKPKKLEYFEGEKFDPTGLSLVVVYDDGETAAVQEGYSWDLTDALKDGDEEVKITYRNRSVVLDISVKVKIPVSLELLSEDLPEIYYVDQKFETSLKTPIKLKATYEDDSTEEVTEGYTVSPKSAMKIGLTEVKITYKKSSLTIPVFVEIAKVESLEVVKKPNKLSYSVGEYPSTEGLELVAKLSGGSEIKVPDYYFERVPFKKGDDKLTLSYGGKTVEVEVAVSETANVLSVIKNADKARYAVGENFDYTGLEIALNGTKTTDYEVIGGDNLQIGSVVKAVLKSDESVFAEIPVIVTNEVDIEKGKHLVFGSATESVDGRGFLAPLLKGGKYITDFSDGSIIEVKVNSSSFVKGDVILRLASNYRTKYQNDTWYPSEVKSLQANYWISVFVNGEEIRIPSAVRLGADGSNDKEGGDIYLLGLYRNLRLANVDLKEGENVIRLVVRAHSEILSASTVFKGMPNSPVAAGIFLDTVTVLSNGCGVCIPSEDYAYDEQSHWHVCSDCGKVLGEKEAHSFTEKVASEKYLKEEATCTSSAVYFKSCVCGVKGEETFTYGSPVAHEALTEATCTKKAVCKHCGQEFGELKAHEALTEATCTKKAVCKVCKQEFGELKAHDFEFKAENELHYKKCKVCGYETEKTATHIYSATASEKDGVQTVILTCACGHTETKTLSQTDGNYHNITSDMLKGENTIEWAAGGYASRTGATIQSGSTSPNVKKAENASYNKDYVTYLYGGSRVEINLNVTKNTTASFVIKASSGWLQQINWGGNASKTGNMVFNKIFKAYIRHADGGVTEIAISDDMILKGASGGYEIMANWTYIALTGVAVKAGDTFVLESLTPKTEDGKYVYWDGKTEAVKVADRSISSGETQSTANLDTIAVYYDE